MRFTHWALGFCLVGVVLAAGPYSQAIPAFSRQYGTSCSTCHVDFPKLNDFGKAFKDAGFKFPKDDETFMKIPPVLLGAPAQKEMWPHSIWPGTLPGLPMIGLRFNTFFQVYGKNRNNFAPPGPGAPGIPRTDFQPGLFSIFTAGNFGSGIAFWVDDDFSVGGANSNGGLGDGYLKFHNIGRLFKLPNDSLNLRVGQFEIDLPFSPARSWNLSGWDIYDEANFGAANGLGPGVNNSFAFSSPGQGVEISGGHMYKGYHYSLAVLNQNTNSGAVAAGANVSPEVGIFSDSNFKDLYGRFQYRFNLEKDVASRNDIRLQLQLSYFQPVWPLHVRARPEPGVGPGWSDEPDRGSVGALQRRFPGSRLFSTALADDDHAVRPRAIDGGLPERPGCGQFLCRGQRDAEPGHARCPVPDPRQHQGIVRIPNPAEPDGYGLQGQSN